MKFERMVTIRGHTLVVSTFVLDFNLGISQKQKGSSLHVADIGKSDHPSQQEQLGWMLHVFVQ
jgi:hypothetical protein